MKWSSDTRSKIINTLSHAAGWLLFFSLIIGFLSNSPDGSTHIFSKLFSPPFLIFYGVYLTLFYSNYFLLIPKLFFKKNYAVYFFIIICMFAAVYFIKPFDRLISMNPPPGSNLPPRMEMRTLDGPPPRKPFGSPVKKDINSIILFVTVWSLSSVICIIREWRGTEKRALQAETDKVNAELAFLKSQVNPHFLFNTLNNIYSMALTGNEHTAPSIMRLSNIMRYITDEAGEDWVPLENEIECLRDYVDLQRVRLNNRTHVDFKITGDPAQRKIAPLLLMAFVENVFKHGISSHEENTITIKISVDEHTIQYYSRNKIFSTNSNVVRNGTGIANARKRLEHVYPDRHFLDISADDGYFTVQLNLKA
jgi:two-component system, LytTR family, sensor kinase